MRVLLSLFFVIFVFGEPLHKISLQLDWKYQFEFGGYIAAKEKGFYKDVGLDVELVEYHNNDIVKDVLNGKYNFGIFDNNLIKEKIDGKEIKLVASIFKRSALVLIVNDKIKTLKQLENKILMIADKDLDTFKRFLNKNGVNIKTIKFVKHTFSITPFLENRVDGFSAFVTDEPYLLNQKGVKFNIINPSDYNFFMYQGELFTSDRFASNNPILVDKFKKATIKGWIWAFNHKKELAQLIYFKYSKHKSIDALIDEANRLEKIVQRRIYPIGFIDRELLEAQFRYELNRLHKHQDIKKIVDSYIFKFQNPLGLNEEYIFLIKLYNFYLSHKIILIISFIFFVILLIVFYFYLRLKKQKDEIFTLFNKAPIGYFLMDYKTRKILNVNDYACFMFQIKREDILNQTTRIFYFSDEEYQKFRDYSNEYLKKHSSIEGFSKNWYFKRKNGEGVWTNIKAIMYNKNRVLWILNDISDFIEKENDLKRAMKVKSEFLANMSHEIRTPLNAILGFVDIIYEKEIDNENRNYLKIIKKSGKSLLTIINDILDFSKIESGKLIIEDVEFNPEEEFETIIHLFDSKAKEKNINLQVNFSNLDYNIISDPTRIKQVISNFLSNAIKFTPKNKSVICNVTYNSLIEKLYVEIIDEGIGIKKDKLQFIFEAFSQADTSTTRKYGGTGLGLAISKSLITLLGGRLKVKSELNKGSKFYFSIPAKKTKKIEESSKIKNQNVNKKFSGELLIVEDNKANQLFAKVILKTFGIEKIDLANDGIEALDKIKIRNYDLILMDENMPNMNGIEATKRIRIMGVKTPIIAVTANALSGDKERFLSSGFDDYVPKPIDKNLLLNVLEKYLKVTND